MLIKIMLLAWFNPLIAQPYHFRVFNQSSGIGSSNIKRIVQDSYGFIWMGTQDGLTRFDGKNATIIKRPQLDGNDVSGLFFDSSTKIIWVAFSQGGVNAINTTTLQTTFSIKALSCYHQIAGKTLLSIFVDSRQQLWLGSTDGLYLLPDTKNDRAILVPLAGFQGQPARSVKRIIAGKNGDIFAAVSACGVARFSQADPDQASYYPFNAGEPQVFDAAYNAQDRSLTVGTDHGVYILQATAKKLLPLGRIPSPALQAKLSGNIYSCAYDREQALWLSTDFGLIKTDETFSRVQAVALTDINQPDFRNIPVSIFFDDEQNVWLGTMAGCYYATTGVSPFTRFTKSARGNPLNHLYFLYPQEGSLLACDENGLYKLDLATQTIKVCDSNKLYYLFFKDFKGNIFCSNQNGLYCWDDQKDRPREPIDRRYPEFKAYQKNNFCTVLYFGDSLIILGSDNSSGIYVWNTRRGTVVNIQEKSNPLQLRSGTVNMLYKKNDHCFWILSDSYIEQYDLALHTITDLTPFFKDLHYFFDIITLRSKTYIACYGTGIIEVDEAYRINQIYSTATSLSNNCVYRLVPQGDSIIWATTNYGLNRIHPASGNVNTYFSEDGLHSNEFEEFSAASYLDKIVVGGLKGFTVIDPSKRMVNTKPPRLYFTNITAETKDSLERINSSDLSIEKIKIPNSWLQVAVSFVGLNYTNPGRVIYQYKINELDTGWRSNGSRNFLLLIGLSPGSYTLQVRAGNEDGYWSAPQKMNLYFSPKWYQTWTFTVALALLTLAILYGFYRYRISQLHQQQQIRRNIASDLHDDFGSTLNSVKVFTHLAKTSTEKETYLTLIEEALTQTAAGLRDMIWVLDNSEDTLHEVLDRTQRFAKPVAGAHHIQFRSSLEITGKDMRISKTEKRNLYLIAKECINNSIKYADCKLIEVLIRQHKNKISLVIRDDGKGFDTQGVSSGNGLRNITERARQIHYHCEITSSPENGTCFLLSKN